MQFVQKKFTYGNSWEMKDILNSPIFYLGLLIKVLALVLFLPSLVTDFYAPFLSNSLTNFSLDPWHSWLDNSGSILAFPYGYVMWITFLPVHTASVIFGIPAEYSYSFSLFICDLILLLILSKIIRGRTRLVLFGYWLSPVVILATYGLGLNDIIPALYLTFSIYFLSRQKLWFSGVFIGLSISAKLSMLLVLPFFILYLYNNKPLRQLMSHFLWGFLVIFVFLGLPFVLSSSGMSMIFNNPEIANILSLSINLTQESVIYLLPILFGIMFYFVWKVRRLNFDLFMAISGVAFLSIVMLTPSASGWFIWTIPFLIFYQALSGRKSVLIVSIFSLLFVTSILLKQEFNLNQGQDINLGLMITEILNNDVASLFPLLDTLIFTLGIVLAIRMWKESINDNYFFRQSRNPFVIGISGDSGSGKDTFSDAVKGLFGDHSTVSLSGDDYHLWDRHKPMWQVMTHLNPMSNDLDGYSRDLLSLVDGKSISTRLYDHATGKMSKPVKIESNDFILASGLHTLYLPEMRDRCNLKIFLEMDEGLRRHLKIKRDVEVRGHSLERVLESIEFRKNDTERFIGSQKKYADIILSLQPIKEGVFNENEIRDGRQLKVVVTTFKGISNQSLNRALVGLCGLHVDMNLSKDGSEVCMTIEGDAFKEDIEMAAKLICPESLDFLDINPKWHDGALGIMQLIAFFHIDQVLTKRYLI